MGRVRLTSRLALLGAALVAVGLLCEGAVRLVAPQPGSWLDVYRSHPEIETWALDTHVELFVDTGETRWWVHTDGRGRRTAKRPRATDARPGALVLGDSFAFGHGLDYDRGLVGLLDADRAVPFAFENTAVPGYGPIQYRWVLAHELARRRKAGEAPPRLVVVVSWLGNDYRDCIRPTNQPVRNRIIGDPGGLKSFVKRTFHLYRLTTRAYHAVAGGERQELAHHARAFLPEQWTTGRYKKAETVYRDEFRRIASLTKASGASLLAVIIPSMSDLRFTRTKDRAAVVKTLVEPSQAAQMDFLMPRRKALGILRDLQIDVVDVTDALAKAPTAKTFFRFDRHLTTFGTRLVLAPVRAKIIALGNSAL